MFKITIPWLPKPSKPRLETGDQGVTILLGYPVMFIPPVLAVFVGLLIVGDYLGITILVAASTFVLVLAAVSWLWSRRSVDGLSYGIVASETRVFPGETVGLTFNVANSSGLSLDWLEIETEVPYRLATGKLTAPSPYMKERLRWTTSISGGQRLTWKDTIECKARGDYRIGPGRLRSGDVFGLFPREKVLPQFARLLVYPRIIPVDRLPLPLRDLTGERMIRRTIYEDVSRTMGVREYQSGDAFKRIHWKASARNTQLKTRQYESTTGLRLLLVLDVFSFRKGDVDEENFELAVSVVASLANLVINQDSTVGLIANSVPPIRIPTRSGRNQLLLLLETLAGVQAKSRLPLQRELENDRRDMHPGTTLAIVTGDLNSSLLGLAHQLHREGRSICLVNVGQTTPAQTFGDIPVVSILGFHGTSPTLAGKS